MAEQHRELTEVERRAFETAKEQGHESLAARAGLIVLFGVGLLVLMGVSLLLMYGLTHRFVALERMPDPDLPMLEPRRAPPPPHVIPHQALDRRRHEQQISQWLDSYGWVDEQAGVARIPVERAIDILAERGLQRR